MSYFTEKIKHAYHCYKNGLSRKKVYAVVEKGDRFVVLKCTKGKYKYCIAGGGIEEGEDIITAIKRECNEELNMNVEYVRTLGTIKDKSKWQYNGEEFLVDDEMVIVYTKFISYGNNKNLGLVGEFDTQDIVVEITKEEMLNNVAEFISYGIKL